MNLQKPMSPLLGCVSAVIRKSTNSPAKSPIPVPMATISPIPVLITTVSPGRGLCATYSSRIVSPILPRDYTPGSMFRPISAAAICTAAHPDTPKAELKHKLCSHCARESRISIAKACTCATYSGTYACFICGELACMACKHDYPL